MVELIYKEQSYKIIGSCFNVYNEMGSGFLEAVYQECLELEFGRNGIPATPQQPLTIKYQGQPLRHLYQADFVCFDMIIVELKAVNHLEDAHRAQLLNYLNATQLKLGLLVNFGNHTKLEYERIVL